MRYYNYSAPWSCVVEAQSRASENVCRMYICYVCVYAHRESALKLAAARIAMALPTRSTSQQTFHHNLTCLFLSAAAK